MCLLLFSCTKVRESAGVTRKSIDEFQVVENPPLIIPPDFNLISPDQLEEKNIDEIDKELAKEILFGLEEEDQTKSKESTSMTIILTKTGANNIKDSIRDQIDEEFFQEKKSYGIFQTKWEDEIEILDAVQESKRIREKIFSGKTIANEDVPIKVKKKKVKKKKRFWIF